MKQEIELIIKTITKRKCPCCPHNLKMHAMECETDNIYCSYSTAKKDCFCSIYKESPLGKLIHSIGGFPDKRWDKVEEEWAYFFTSNKKLISKRSILKDTEMYPEKEFSESQGKK